MKPRKRRVKKHNHVFITKDKEVVRGEILREYQVCWCDEYRVIDQFHLGGVSAGKTSN